MYIIQIANIVKSYFFTAAKRQDAKNLSLSSFLRNKKTFESLLPHPVTVFDPLVLPILTHSHH